MEKQVDSRKVRQILSAYSYNAKYDHCANITKVELFQDEDKFRVMIETHRPGFIIGKGGETISEIKGWIARKLEIENENLVIDLKECNLFSNLYSEKK